MEAREEKVNIIKNTRKKRERRNEKGKMTSNETSETNLSTDK